MTDLAVRPPAEVILDIAAEIPEHYCDQLVGQRVAMRRKQQGLSQKAAAGGRYSPALIGRVERGKAVPPLDLLFWLAVVLDISLPYLQFGYGSPQTKARESRYRLIFMGVDERRLDAVYARKRELRRRG
jgi:transcriptional regulator with XRE-family HTH domain